MTDGRVLDSGYDLLLQRVTASPDSVGLVSHDGADCGAGFGVAPDADAHADGTSTWTFADIDAEVGRAADSLRALVAPGDPVVLYLPNAPALVFALFAVWKVGGVPVLLNHRYDAAEVERVRARLLPGVVVWGRSARGNVSSLSGDAVGRVIDCPELDADLLCTEPSGTGPSTPDLDDDVLAVLLTGGTTGSPKEVTVSRSETVKRIESQRQGQALSRTEGPKTAARQPGAERYNMIATPLFHMVGLKSLLFAWTHDRAVVLMAKFRPATFADLVGRYQVDNLFLLPTMVFDLVHDDVAPDALRSARYVVTGGQALAEDLRLAFTRRFGVPVLSHYGSTEVGGVAGWGLRDIDGPDYDARAVGRVYPGVELAIHDPASGSEMPAGQVGEIAVRPASRAEYLSRQPEDETLMDEDGWIHTGDLGYVDAQYRLFLQGRSKELLKVGGFQVWPGEIADCVRSHPLVRDVAVVGVPHARLGEVPVAVIVPEGALTGLPDGAEATILDHCAAALPTYKVPKRIVYVDRLPRNDAGKVAIGDVRDLALAAGADDAADRPKLHG